MANCDLRRPVQQKYKTQRTERRIQQNSSRSHHINIITLQPGPTFVRDDRYRRFLLQRVRFNIIIIFEFSSASHRGLVHLIGRVYKYYISLREWSPVGVLLLLLPPPRDQHRTIKRILVTTDQMIFIAGDYTNHKGKGGLMMKRGQSECDTKSILLGLPFVAVCLTNFEF